MNLRILMQAGPAKANELFARLSETSDGAVKTREKLFAELKTELELHVSLEEQHLFPILKRNAETKELVGDAIRDNKDLRAKLAELEALPKNDDAFPERLKDLQKAFRQHARDEKRELLPAVQRALSEEQIQRVAEKIEAGVAEAERAKHDEAEARRAKAREEREQAERQVEQQAAAEREQRVAAGKSQQEERELAERQAEQEGVALRAAEQTADNLRDIVKAVGQTATTSQTNVFQLAETAATGAQRVVTDAAQAITSNSRAAASLPHIAVGAMTDLRGAWMECIGQTTLAGTEMSRQIVRRAAEQQRQFVGSAVQSWMEGNGRIMQFALEVAFRPFAGWACQHVHPQKRPPAPL
jgi:hemerythrin-like domain-containing protein